MTRESKYPDEEKTLGQKIRKKRMDLGKSLLEIANQANITESYLSRIESDKKKPTWDVADKIAKALQVNPSEYYSYLLQAVVEGSSPPTSIPMKNYEEFAKLFKHKKS